MTDSINEIMGRLQISVLSGLLSEWDERDLKALLSYTKQCREKMDLALRHLDEGFSPSGGMYSGGSVELVAARQALSTQPGERE